LLFSGALYIHAAPPKVADKVLPEQESEWVTTRNFAQKALRDGEWSLTRELYQNALILAPNATQKALAYAYIGTSYYNENRIKPALENLNQAIYLLEKQTPLPRENLMAILNFAAQVAHEGDQKYLSTQYTKKLVSYYASDPKIWQINKPKDIYHHKLTGINFPEKIGEFRRISVDAYQPTGKDVGASYRDDLKNDKFIKITTYATFIGNQSLDKVFSAYDQGMIKYLEQVDFDKKGKFKIPGSKTKGRYILYLTNYGQGKVLTGMWLMEFDNWYIKIRATYPYDQKKKLYKMVKGFIKNFPWQVKGIVMTTEDIHHAIFRHAKQFPID